MLPQAVFSSNKNPSCGRRGLYAGFSQQVKQPEVELRRKHLGLLSRTLLMIPKNDWALTFVHRRSGEAVIVAKTVIHYREQGSRYMRVRDRVFYPRHPYEAEIVWDGVTHAEQFPRSNPSPPELAEECLVAFGKRGATLSLGLRYVSLSGAAAKLLVTTVPTHP